MGLDARRMADKPELLYFNFGGRAAPIRKAFELGHVEFTDTRLSPEQFGKLKASGELPVGASALLKVGGKSYTQSLAQLTYAAGVGDAKLYPEDALQQLAVNEVLLTNEDITSVVVPTLRVEKDKLKEAREAITPKLRTLIDGFAKQLEKNGTAFAATETLSIADLTVLGFLGFIGRMDHLPDDLTKAAVFDRLRAKYEGIDLKLE